MFIKLDESVTRTFPQVSIDGMIVFFAFVLANLRASIFIHLFPDVSILFGPAWIEIALWFLVLLVMLYRLASNDQIDEYLSMWRRNLVVSLFILLALLSVFWSVDPVVSLFRGLELLFSTLIAAYLGSRYRLSQILDILFWFGAIVLILSIAMAFAAPKAGTMYWAPFNGAWRGLFWHRNHLSSLTALFSVVFLCRAILALEKRNVTGFLDVIFYVLSLVVLFFAKSATGYILFIILNFLVLGIWLWLKMYPRLRAWHYISILGVFSVSLLLIFSNLNIVFGLFNRTTTLTGRVGLWAYLFNNIVTRRLGWGHGFGAIWTLDSFREQVRQNIGWTSQPLIADNGFLDILLHLGMIGFLLLLIILVIAAAQFVRNAVSGRMLTDFFPLLFLSYVLIANIPFSMIAETEVFVWSLLVIFLFTTTPSLPALNSLKR